MKYFKHELDVRDNDKIFELIEAHGMQGYGIWWAIVEELYKCESDGFQIAATDTWFKRLSKALNLTDWRTLVRILDTMAEQGLICPQMWAEHMVLAPGIAERADSYMRQKELAAQRKREQRERDRAARDEASRVTPKGQVKSHASVTTNTDPDPDPDPDLDPTYFLDSEGRKKEKPEISLAPFPPGDPFDQGAAAKNAQIFLMGLDGNTWNIAALKAWASCWEESGRNPGKDYINLKKFIRKRIHPKAEDHQSFLDEYQGVRASLEKPQGDPQQRIITPPSGPAPPPGTPEYRKWLFSGRVSAS